MMWRLHLVRIHPRFVLDWAANQVEKKLIH